MVEGKVEGRRRIAPLTSSKAKGAVVPMPTFPFFKTVMALDFVPKLCPLPMTKRGSVATQVVVLEPKVELYEPTATVEKESAVTP